MSDDLFDLILYIPLTIFQLRPNKKYVCFSLHEILKIPKMSDDKKMNATLKIGVVSALLETFLSFFLLPDPLLEYHRQVYFVHSGLQEKSTHLEPLLKTSN